MVLTFYYDLLSQPCRAVYMFLKMNGIEFKDVVLSIPKGEHKTPDMAKKNPTQKLPCLHDDGFVLNESVAIMRYLAKKHKVAEHWYGGSNDQLSAKIDEFVNWQHSGLRKPCNDVFFPEFVSKKVEGGFPKSPSDRAWHERKESEKSALKETIIKLGENYLKVNKYLCGDEISIADLLACNELVQLDITGYQDLYLKDKRVAAWMTRIQDRAGTTWREAMVRRDEMKKAFEKAK